MFSKPLLVFGLRETICSKSNPIRIGFSYRKKSSDCAFLVSADFSRLAQATSTKSWRYPPETHASRSLCLEFRSRRHRRQTQPFCPQQDRIDVFLVWVHFCSSSPQLNSQAQQRHTNVAATTFAALPAHTPALPGTPSVSPGGARGAAKNDTAPPKQRRAGASRATPRIFSPRRSPQPSKIQPHARRGSMR